MYSLVAAVVRNDGLLNRKENTGLGWSCAGIVVVMNMAFHYKDYGSPDSFINTGEHYHCWLDYQTGDHHPYRILLHDVPHRPAVWPDAPLAAPNSPHYCPNRGFWCSH